VLVNLEHSSTAVRPLMRTWAATGQELWFDRLEKWGTANPMTYQGNAGRQDLVVAVTDTVAAYELPQLVVRAVRRESSTTARHRRVQTP
jgi:hypothetical protein